MAIFAMPSLGADMEAGTLVQWMIQPGDTVKRGDVVAVVETQKGAIEIECFEEGIVQSLDAELGATLAVGAALATITPSKGARITVLSMFRADTPSWSRETLTDFSELGGHVMGNVCRSDRICCY